MDICFTLPLPKIEWYIIYASLGALYITAVQVNIMVGTRTIIKPDYESPWWVSFFAMTLIAFVFYPFVIAITYYERRKFLIGS